MCDNNKGKQAIISKEEHGAPSAKTTMAMAIKTTLLLVLPFLFPFVAATKEKVAVWNMIGDDLKVHIQSSTEELHGRISFLSVTPHIFHVDYAFPFQEEPQLKVLRLNRTEDVIKEVTLPLFNGRSPHTFKNIANPLSRSPKGEFNKLDVLFYQNQKETDRLVELVPVWTISSSIADFAVYLLYPNGSVFSTPWSHDQINIDFSNDKFRKRKTHAEEFEHCKQAKTTHTNHEDVGSKNSCFLQGHQSSQIGKIENIKMGVFNKVKDDIRVEFYSGGELTTSTKIHKNDNTLHIYDISFDTTKTGCNDDQILTAFILDNDVEVFDASIPILNEFHLDTLRDLVGSHGKEMHELIFVWTLYANERAELELYWLHHDGTSTKAMSIIETTFIWDSVEIGDEEDEETGFPN